MCVGVWESVDVCMRVCVCVCVCVCVHCGYVRVGGRVYEWVSAYQRTPKLTNKLMSTEALV